MSPKKVLITGASGLVGTRLTELLLQRQIEVVHLSREAGRSTVPAFTWNVASGTIDDNAFDGVDAIVHLAGAGVADKRWTPSRKMEILNSRVLSTRLLFTALRSRQHGVRAFIGASAIGYYGFGMGDEPFTETSLPGTDFLADVVVQWEREVSAMQSLGLRTVLLRIGIVLSRQGGALKEMAKPVAWGVGAPLSSGKQYLSWIHLDDLCRMFLFALENHSMEGVYNAAGPQPVTNREFTKALATVMQKPLWLPPVPGFIIKLLLGEMADMVLNGSVVSSAKIQQAGYTFLHPDLHEALRNLLKK